MHIFKRIREEGISLRITHAVMFIGTAFVMCLLLYNTFRTSSLYAQLSEVTNDYIELQTCAEELMEASDYLTDKVQRFTVKMFRADMDAYCNEAYTTRRRDQALAKVHEISGDSEAFRQLTVSMYESNALMTTELTAMHIICDVCGYQGIPSEIENTRFPENYLTLSTEQKLSLAQEMVHDDAYYRTKTNIRSGMENCIKALVTDTHGAQSALTVQLQHRSSFIRILVIVQSVSILLILWMTSYLGISPILRAVQKIKENHKIPEKGSHEFRYLAKAFNKMFDAFQSSIENLNYDASHDKLTGLYNRAGYDVLLQRIELHSTAVLLIDADKFKEINDTFGHATGDSVLKKIANTLKMTFRHEDYICRLGGDEFVVFMRHMDNRSKELIQMKTDIINKRLGDTRDGLPKISISVGVAFGLDEQEIREMIKHADEALYKMKAAGRCGCTFYDAGAQA